jgi:hypothetical protein
MDEVFLKYGISGAAILCLGIYILKLEERHRKERKEEREARGKDQDENRKLVEKMFDREDKRADESNRVTRENTNILAGLKSLLENQKK